MLWRDGRVELQDWPGGFPGGDFGPHSAALRRNRPAEADVSRRHGTPAVHRQRHRPAEKDRRPPQDGLFRSSHIRTVLSGTRQRLSRRSRQGRPASRADFSTARRSQTRRGRSGLPRDAPPIHEVGNRRHEEAVGGNTCRAGFGNEARHRSQRPTRAGTDSSKWKHLGKEIDGAFRWKWKSYVERMEIFKHYQHLIPQGDQRQQGCDEREGMDVQDQARGLKKKLFEIKRAKARDGRQLAEGLPAGVRQGPAGENLAVNALWGTSARAADRKLARGVSRKESE